MTSLFDYKTGISALALVVASTVWPISGEAKKSKNTAQNTASKIIAEMTIEAPKPNEVCFSPDGHCDLKLVKLIESAQSSIDLAIFDINLDQVVHALAKKSLKIPVRIVADRRQGKSQRSLISTLVKTKVPVKFGVQRGIMHNKFIVIDKKMVMLGSFNFTNGAAFKNQENQLYLDNPEIVKKYSEKFEEIWKSSKDVR